MPHGTGTARRPGNGSSLMGGALGAPSAGQCSTIQCSMFAIWQMPPADARDGLSRPPASCRRRSRVRFVVRPTRRQNENVSPGRIRMPSRCAAGQAQVRRPCCAASTSRCRRAVRSSGEAVAAREVTGSVLGGAPVSRRRSPRRSMRRPAGSASGAAGRRRRRPDAGPARSRSGAADGSR